MEHLVTYSSWPGFGVVVVLWLLETKGKHTNDIQHLDTDLGATEKFAYGPILPIASSTATFRRYGALLVDTLCVNCNCSTYHRCQNHTQIQISFKILKELVAMLMTTSLRILKEIWIWTGFWELWELFRANWWALILEIAHQTLYFFESFLVGGYGKNRVTTINEVFFFENVRSFFFQWII